MDLNNLREQSDTHGTGEAQALSREPIAIIGIGCRLPGGGDNPDNFWNLLANSMDAIRPVPKDRWDLNAFYDSEPGKAGKLYVREGGFLDQVDQFDPHFFGISPREAEVMDPQQRLLLEVCWEALEDAGIPGEQVDGTKTGVFVGICSHDYGDVQAQPCERKTTNPYVAQGTTLCIAANRLSYLLGLRGPSLAVDTACSSSMVALHLACQSLWQGESNLGLVGGVNLLLRPETTLQFCNASMLSPDARCKSFDADANGYVRSEGAAMIAVKSLAQAVHDQDRIYALIHATTVNQDGRTNGMSVPNGESQKAMLREVYHKAGVSPGDVQYVEAHGTGTPVGDPIEAEAIGSVVGENRPEGEFCWMGSVKSNVGHLEAGAGIVGIVKTALALYHRQIPANLHFHTPNPKVDLDRLRLRIPVEQIPWPDSPQRSRIAGVSSFGFGGTNAHAVLSGAPSPCATSGNLADGTTPHLIPISARSSEALKAQAKVWQDWLLDSENDSDFLDIGYTASVRRSHHPHRLALVAKDRKQLATQLEAFGNEENGASFCTGRMNPEAKPKLVFVFTGMGPQWWAMGRQLLDEEQVFCDAVLRCDELFSQHAAWSLLEELTAKESVSRITEPDVSQPAIFALQVGLASLWRSWGVIPDAILGHSVGEVAAAHAAGVLTLVDAVKLIFHRSRLQNQARGSGKMLALGLPLQEVTELLQPWKDRVSVAAVNSPGSVTISGEEGVLQDLQATVEETGAFCRMLQVDVPYHSPKMDPLCEELHSVLADLCPKSAGIPLYSPVTGKLLDGVEMDAHYWWRNVREPVQFAQAMENLLQASHDTFLEIGPHPVLPGAIRECASSKNQSAHVLCSLRRHEDEREMMLSVVGRLYVLGYPVEWSRFYPSGKLAQLPRYPWQRERYWHENEEGQAFRTGERISFGQKILSRGGHPLLGQKVQSARSEEVWHLELDVQRDHHWLTDHCVQGEVLFPASSFIEMALAAGEQLSPDSPLGIEHVSFQEALFLNHQYLIPVQLVVSDHGTTFEISSRNQNGDWTQHAWGRFRSKAVDPVDKSFIQEEVQNRGARTSTRDQVYETLHGIGLEYGPAFQTIEHLWHLPGEALGKLQLSDQLANGHAQYQLHPALLDACFQVPLGAVSIPEEPAENSSLLYLPKRADRIVVHQSADRTGTGIGRGWAHVRLLEHQPSTLKVSIRLLDEHGATLAEVEKLELSAVPRGNISQTIDDHLYEHRWEPQEGPAIPDEEGLGTWLILADNSGIGSQLAQLLTQCGGEAILVRSGSTFEPFANNDCAARPGVREDLRQIFERVVQARGNVDRIVHLWSLDTNSLDNSPATLQQAQQSGCLSGLDLAQQCCETDWPTKPPTLHFVVGGAQSVVEGEPVEVTHSPLWGLARVIGNEHPELRASRIDSGHCTTESDVSALFAELRNEDLEDEVAIREGQRYVHRFVSTSMNEIRARARSQSSQASPLLQSDQSLPFHVSVGNRGMIQSLRLLSQERQIPGESELEIEVHTAGMNFKDVAKALNLLSEDTLANTFSGHTLGLECAGTVVAVGSGVEHLQPGDEVIALASGTFQTHITISTDFVARKPAALSFEEAGTVSVVFLTAWQALHNLARLQPGERILIHSAAGGVGQAAVQLAQRCGSEIFATAGSPEKRNVLQSQGIAHVMDSRSLDFAAEILDRTGGEGVDVVLNSLSGKAAALSLSLLRPCGRFVEIGKREIEQNHRLGLSPFQENLSWFALDMDRLWVAKPEAMRDLFQKILRNLETGELSPLPVQVFPISKVQEAFQHVARAKHVGKVGLSFKDSEAEVQVTGEEPLVLRKDGTYVITGGLGGFGLATAHWLVQHGARHLLLLGRRGASTPAAQESVQRLKNKGAEISVEQVDVTDFDQIRDSLENARRTGPPIRGILHAAMVLDDGVLLQQNHDRFEKVLAPKMMGAWNLHRLTGSDPLDFFVLFSSVANVFGNRGQSNYAAANAFLDALARQRRADGLPGLSVSWTAIRDIGYVADHPEVEAHLASLGLPALDSDWLLKILAGLLRHGAVETSVLRLDTARWSQKETIARAPRFSGIVHHSTSSDSTGPSRLVEILSASASERGELVEESLREQISAVLGMDPAKLETDTRLADAGMDSLMAIELTVRLKKAFEMDVPTMKLMGGTTIGELRATILEQLLGAEDGETDSVNGVDPGIEKDVATVRPDAHLMEDARLDPAIRPEDVFIPVSKEPKKILLTGATGFLGAFLLKELLEQTDQAILCLVRCRNPDEGKTRIQRAMEKFLIELDSCQSRIEAVPGDLAKPLLGLDPADYHRIAEQVDSIYHNGAQVDLARSYQTLKSVNVQGTEEIIRFALQGHPKSLHYVSSLGVLDLPAPPNPVTFFEQDAPHRLDELRYGYTQSKAVAELKVREAGDRGGAVTIYRPGLVNACSETGACTTQDMGARLIKSWIDLGMIPDLESRLLLTPVDYLSKAIVFLSQTPDAEGQTFHLVSAESMTIQGLGRLVQGCGYQLEEVPYWQWRSQLKRYSGAHSDRSSSLLLPLLSDSDEQLPIWPPENVSFDARNAVVRLERAGVTCPRIDLDYVQLGLEYFEQIGFLETGTEPREESVAGN